MDEQARHEQTVQAKIERGRALGLSWNEMERQLQGAEPRLVARLRGCDPREWDRKAKDAAGAVRGGAARREVAVFTGFLPAPDPLLSQWWFTLDSVIALSARVSLASSGSVAFLGSPTIAHRCSLDEVDRCLALDADRDVVEALMEHSTVESRTYDVADPIPDDLVGQFSVVVADPPWYQPVIETFITRARQLCAVDGTLMITLPPLLTRPSVDVDRTNLTQALISAGFRILGLDMDALEYVVPSWESKAYKDLAAFGSQSWRRGDLLTLRVSAQTMEQPFSVMRKAPRDSFHRRKASTYRVFSRPVEYPEQARWAERVTEFSATVSTRNAGLDRVGVWDTERRGVSVRDYSIARQILGFWEEGKELEETEEALARSGYADAHEAVDAMGQLLDLWPTGDPIRKSDEDLQKERAERLRPFASNPSDHKTPDGFRLAFQRDRDRILWSESLRRLANKTQLFPTGRDDQLRRRLTHSMEVMQLAGTIARDLGLDSDLTEAGSLGHDLGHPPFGHPGEYAINRVLRDLTQNKIGFNHYEHGADVVRFLETAYLSPGAGGTPGLELETDTVEAILKHAFKFRTDTPAGDEIKPASSQHDVLAESKHNDIVNDDYCHLEGQAVRIADKVSYLISDLEDGIRLGAIGLTDLQACRLFDHPPIDLVPANGESLSLRFVSQRRALLRILMEDVIVVSAARIRAARTRDGIRGAGEYTIDYSDDIRADVNQVWNRLQAGLLHQDPRVARSNARAARVVSGLLLLFTTQPKLVEPAFGRAHELMRAQRPEYMGFYLDVVGSKVLEIDSAVMSPLSLESVIGNKPEFRDGKWQVPLQDLILAKDYVASLTDPQALALYRDLVGAQD